MNKSSKLLYSFVAIVVLATAAFVFYRFYYFSAERPVEDNFKYYKKPFIEVVYEQSYTPFDGRQLTPREPPPKLDGYFYYGDSKKLFSCMGKRSRLENSFLLGIRLHFHLGPRVSSLQALQEQPETDWQWQVDRHPDLIKMRQLNQLCWLRVPTTFYLELDDRDYLVHCDTDKPRRLSPGIPLTVWRGQRKFKFDEYIAELSAYKRGVMTPEQRQTGREILHVDENDELTIYGRITAIYHGKVDVCEHDPKATYRAAWNLYRKKKHDKALKMMQEYLKMVRRDPRATAIIHKLRQLAEDRDR